MDEFKVEVPSVYFPNQFASDAEKDSKTFGLAVGRSIQYEWFRKDNRSLRFYDQWSEFHRLRLYARGEQSVQKYKDEMSVDGDLSHLNIDWAPVPIIPKFVDIVVNGMNNRLFSVKAYAQDAMSAEKRSQYQDMVQADMISKDILMLIKDEFGVDTFDVDPEQLPANDDELSLYMQLNYKPAIEIAEEEAINTVLEANRYDELKKRLDYDQVVLGISFAKHQFLPGTGIKLEYVDPQNMVYSYTEDPFFRDCFYFGEVKSIAVSELLKIDPTLTSDQLEEISKYGQAWYNYYNSIQLYNNNLYNKNTTTLLYFNYKTTKKFVYKKKYLDNGSYKIIEKDENFNPPKEMMDEGKFERIEKRIDVWYEGILVMGTSILLKWEMSKNMVRPKSASQYAIPNYVACAPRMYKGAIESTVRRMIPFADLIQLTHLKLQQVIAKIVPDGVFVDADGINEVDLGTGAAYNPEDALRLYFQTGSIIGRSFTQDGEFNNARIPIQELNTNSGQAKISALITSYNQYLNMIRDVTGLNEARDASMPNPDALVGVQKLAALNSNTATRHILEASLYMTKCLAEAISYRISDVLEFSEFTEQFIMQIGKYNVNILNEIKDLYLYDFGIFIEIAPDEEEKAQLEANIQMAIAKGNIDIEDAIDIREIKNIKLANQLLKLKRKKKQERDQQAQQMQMQMQGQVNMQSQQAAAQARMQEIQLEGQVKMQIKQTEVQLEMQKMMQEAALKKELMGIEFDMNMQLKGVDASLLKSREDNKEKAKDDRIFKQATAQSKLIEQRKNNLPPINFESNEDTLDGFSLEEFDVR